MKKNRMTGSLVVFVMCVFLFTSCGVVHFGLKDSDFTNVLAESTAFMLGYKGWEKAPSKFEAAARIATGEIDVNERLSQLRDQLTETITNDPGLKYLATKVLNQIDINVTTDVVDIPVSKKELVHRMMQEFAFGVDMARGEVE